MNFKNKIRTCPIIVAATLAVLNPNFSFAQAQTPVNEWSNVWAEYWSTTAPLLPDPLSADSLLDCSYEGCILWRYVCDRFSALSPSASGPLFGSDVMKEMLALASPGATIDWTALSHWMETHPAAKRSHTSAVSLVDILGHGTSNPAIAAPNIPVLDDTRRLLERLSRTRYPLLTGVGVYSDWLVANVVQGLANAAGIPFGYCDGRLAPDRQSLVISLQDEQSFGVTMQPLKARYCSFDVTGLGGAVRLKISAAPLTGTATMEPSVQVVITDNRGILDIFRDSSGIFDREIKNGDYHSTLSLQEVAIRTVIVILSTGADAGASFSFALTRA